MFRTRHGPSSVARNNYLNGSQIPFRLGVVNDPPIETTVATFQPTSCNFSLRFSPVAAYRRKKLEKRKQFLLLWEFLFL